MPEGQPYRVCFECGHVYMSPVDLHDAHIKVLREMGEALDGDYTDAPFCACCTHDF